MSPNATSGAAPIRLRPHHLLCMLTFVGEGYSLEFCENYARVLERLQAGTPLTLVAGPDDLCSAAPRAGVSVHCAGASVGARDRAAATALRERTELQPLFAAGGELVFTASLVADLRARFATGAIRAACTGCEWSPLCTLIAADGFATTIL